MAIGIERRSANAHAMAVERSLTWRMPPSSDGYEYIAITDHTQGLKIARGLDEKRLRQQGLDIAALKRSLKSRGLIRHEVSGARNSPAPNLPQVP
jgi:hypothetical protein